MSLQFNMFDGKPHDNRTRAQRKRQREAGQPRAEFMFSAEEMGRPSWQTRQHADGPLLMEIYDPRTPEQKDADALADANAMTEKLL